MAARSSWSSRPKLCSTFGREVFVAGSHSLWVNCKYRTGVPSLFRRVATVRARVQAIHDFDQLIGSNIDRTCVFVFQRFGACLDTLTLDDPAACVQICPLAAE